MIEYRGDLPELAAWEFRCLAKGTEEASGPRWSLWHLDAFAGQPDAFSFDRLGLTRRISRVLAEGEPLDRFDQTLIGAGTFAIRRSKLGGASLRDRIPGIAAAIDRSVDLKRPDQEFRLFETDLPRLGLVVHRETNSDDRAVKNRPFFSPISLHPRLARTLLNLTGVAAGAQVLDPFCGTGGILIEGAMMGLEMHGSDTDPRMVRGSQENLGAWGFKATIAQRDARDIQGIWNAIVFDPPYGRASSTNREDARGLVRSAIISFRDHLAPGGKVACIVPEIGFLADLDGWELIGKQRTRVHGSLDRWFALLRPD